MNTEQLKETLKKLHKTINDTKQVDAELAELLSVLDEDIQQLLIKECPEEDALSNLGERSLSLSAKFAAQNPRLEMALREIADILARMGI